MQCLKNNQPHRYIGLQHNNNKKYNSDHQTNTVRGILAMIKFTYMNGSVQDNI